jgi:hypothetical protein
VLHFSEEQEIQVCQALFIAITDNKFTRTTLGNPERKAGADRGGV